MARRILSFKPSEFVGVTLILCIVIGVTFVNLKASYRRSRDLQRKNDVRSLFEIAYEYKGKYGSFPLSQDGKIVACNPYTTEAGVLMFKACEWYQSEALGKRVLGDPQQGQGGGYYYVSTGDHFQAFGALESTKEDEYDPAILARGLMCNGRVCNFGRSSEKTPTDISLEEYEATLPKK